jgi:hypothetical protein
MNAELSIAVLLAILNNFYILIAYSWRGYAKGASYVWNGAVSRRGNREAENGTDLVTFFGFRFLLPALYPKVSNCTYLRLPTLTPVRRKPDTGIGVSILLFSP